MSRHICFHCQCGREEFAASARFTTLFWDDLLGVLEGQSLSRPSAFVADDTEVEGAALSRWLEAVVERLEDVSEALPTLHQIWRIYPDGDTWGSEAGYFRWGGEPYMVDSVYDQLVVRRLDQTQWEERREWVPYPPPVLEEVAPEIVPAPRTDRYGERSHTLAAAEFERLFQGTPLRLEHGSFLEFLLPEVEEARTAARHAAEAGERVVLYTY